MADWIQWQVRNFKANKCVICCCRSLVRNWKRAANYLIVMNHHGDRSTPPPNYSLSHVQFICCIVLTALKLSLSQIKWDSVPLKRNPQECPASRKGHIWDWLLTLAISRIGLEWIRYISYANMDETKWHLKSPSLKNKSLVLKNYPRLLQSWSKPFQSHVPIAFRVFKGTG